MSRQAVKDFIGKPAPSGYVAGVGRGASGFTTRSDIGPANEGPSRSSGDVPRKIMRRDDDDEEKYNDTNYDEFEGYRGSLFSNVPYDKEDEEADRIYSLIDKHQDERSLASRKAKAAQELEAYKSERSKIQQQFSDLKSQLSTVSEQEWLSIPEVGDARNRKQRIGMQDKYTPVPDTLLAHQAKLASGGERLVYLDPKNLDNETDQDKTSYDTHVNDMEPDDDIGQQTARTSLIEPQAVKKDAKDFDRLNIGMMSELRGSYISMTLSNASDANTKANLKNAADYLSDIQSIPTLITDQGTLKMYRQQFASLRNSNPDFENAWIASVRLEEAAGKVKEAQKLIREACEVNPDKPDLWCEAARLHPTEISKGLLFKALELNPHSVKLWLRAADLEKDVDAKRKVFKNARKMVPTSVLLWKKSVALEKPDQARTLLRDAVVQCSESVDFWLALARLEPYEEAQKVLIEASKRHPTDRSIWIMAAKLEEAADNNDMVAAIIERVLEQSAEKAELKSLDVDLWLKEAVDADKAGFDITCREIVRRVMHLSFRKKQVQFEESPDPKTDSQKEDQGQDQQRKANMWLGWASKLASAQSIVAARTIYQTLVSIGHAQQQQQRTSATVKPSLTPKTQDSTLFNKMETVWLAWLDFEKVSGDKDSHLDTLRKSVSADNCCKCDKLWLMLAHEMRDNHDDSKRVLTDALAMNPNSEAIVLALVEMECDRGNTKAARKILADACMSAKSAELVMRSAKLEWKLGNLDEAVRLLVDGKSQYKDFGPFYLTLAQIEEQRNSLNQATKYYGEGIRHCPHCVDLWVNFAALGERSNQIALARSRLQNARLKNPTCVRLWLESVRLEVRLYQAKRRSGELKQTSRPDVAMSLLADAAKKCKGQPDYADLELEQKALERRSFKTLPEKIDIR